MVYHLWRKAIRIGLVLVRWNKCQSFPEVFQHPSDRPNNDFFGTGASKELQPCSGLFGTGTGRVGCEQSRLRGAGEEEVGLE